MATNHDAPAGLLARLRSSGFTLRADAGRLLVSPAALLTPALREAVAGNRDGLLALLKAEADAEAASEAATALWAAEEALPHQGWVREKGRKAWTVVATGTNYLDCLAKLLRVPTQAKGRELVVLPVGREP